MSGSSFWGGDGRRERDNVSTQEQDEKREKERESERERVTLVFTATTSQRYDTSRHTHYDSIGRQKSTLTGTATLRLWRGGLPWGSSLPISSGKALVQTETEWLDEGTEREGGTVQGRTGGEKGVRPDVG